MRLAFARGASPPSRKGYALYPLWRSVTYFSALIAFGSLFATGELNPVVSAAFFAAWIFGYFLKRPPEAWRPWMSHMLTLVVIAIIASGAKAQFFQSILHLILFLVLSKCYSLKTNRDYLQTQLLCFFVLLAASVMTVSFYFVLFFAAQLFLGTTGLMLYSLARREEPAGAQNQSRADETSRMLPQRVLRTSAALTGLVLALIIFYFIFIPHLSIRRLDAPFSMKDAQQEGVTGFGEEITFGAFKSLQPDARTVLQVEFVTSDGQTLSTHPPSLYLRGLPLEHYDEVKWRRSPQRDQMWTGDEQRLITRIDSLQKGEEATVKIYQDPDVTKRVFTLPNPLEVIFQSSHRVRFDPQLAIAQIIAFGTTRENAYTNPFTYHVQSRMIEEASGLLPHYINAVKKGGGLAEDSGNAPSITLEQLATMNAEAMTSAALAQKAATAASRLGSEKPLPWRKQIRPMEMDEQERAINLQLPQSRMTEAIRTLARRIAPGPTAAEIIHQSLTYFRRNFDYTLAPETPSGEHPIQAFLFSTQKGHCEYFATSLALMLRTRGVPARVVNGFYATEWNQLAKVFNVKQSDAHAWTEVWLDGQGWITVDPTPPNSAGRAAYGLGQPTYLTMLGEYLRIQWQRYVIDYSSGRQVRIFRAVREAPGFRALFAISEYARNTFRPKLSNPGRQNDRLANNTDPVQMAMNRVVDAAVILGFIFAAVWIGRKIRRHSKGGTGVDYFDELLERLERLGFQRKPHQTAGEFIRLVEASGRISTPLNGLLELYQLDRYAERPPGRHERNRAREIIRALKVERIKTA